jgi:GT2 family glycosyltransferase
MKTAVLMPSYNPGAELRATLDSLRAQTIPFRLFLVDDGSPKKPDYRPLLEGLDHVLIELPKNLGITGALNAGLAEILKQPFLYIARLDNGDICAPLRLEVQQAFCEKHPEIDIVGSNLEVVFEDTGDTLLEAPAQDHDTLARRLRYNTVLSHPSMMIRADLFRRVGFYSDAYDAAEDYELCHRAVRTGAKLASIPETLLTKIENANSISWKKRGKQLRSRLRIQLHYARATDPHAWAGAARTALQIMLPQGAVRALKRRFKSA